MRLRFRGVQRLIYPRRTPWDYSSVDILELWGPVKVSEDLWYLRLYMQDGNQIEVDYASVDVELVGPAESDGGDSQR